MLALLYVVLDGVSAPESGDQSPVEEKEIEMSVATEKITEMQDQVLDFVARMQEPVVKGLRTAATKVEDRFPEVKAPWLGDKVPTATEFVELQFDFSQRLLDNQREFAEAVLDAMAPVRKKFVGAPAKPAVKSTTTKVKAA